MLKILGKIIALTMILTAGAAFANASDLNLEFPIFVEGPSPSPDFIDTSFSDSIRTCRAVARVQVRNLEEKGIQVTSQACDYDSNHSMPEMGMYAFTVKITAKGQPETACAAMTIKADSCSK